MEKKTEADLPRAARATRGKRLTKLLDDEVEADNTFWEQDAFKEENNDREYEQEEEQVDEFDSDFDEEEPESDPEGEQQEPKEVVKKKKKFPYKKPGIDKKKKSVSFLLKNAIRTDKVPSKPKKAKPTQTKQQQQEEDESERTIRKSSRVSVVAKQAERAARALLVTPKPVKKKKEGERKMTQEEMLLEAAQTEVINLQSLERMLAREEEVKKKAIVQKTLYTGPQIRFISKDGYNILEFTKVNSFPSCINSKAKPYPERAVCVVTGQPARYKDPKTGLPYATKEAFKVLRERYTRSDKNVEEIHQRKRTRVETERSGSRAGAMKLKFQRSNSNKDMPKSAQVHTPPPPLPPPPPPPPIEIEEVDEADFMLEGLEEKSRGWGIEENIIYETNEMTEATFMSGDVIWSRYARQQQHR